MSMQGEPDGEPMKVAVAISDIVAGQFAAAGIMAALVRRGANRRGRHGRGVAARRAGRLARQPRRRLADRRRRAGAARERPPLDRPVRDVPCLRRPHQPGRRQRRAVRAASAARPAATIWPTTPTSRRTRCACWTASGSWRSSGETIATQPRREWVDVLERASRPGRAGAGDPRGVCRPRRAHGGDDRRTPPPADPAGATPMRIDGERPGAACLRRAWASTRPRCWPRPATRDDEASRAAAGRLRLASNHGSPRGCGGIGRRARFRSVWP